MATDNIAGLFATPEQYQQSQLAQQQANAMAMAQLTPEQQANAGLRVAGYQLGSGIAGALGAQDPQLQLLAQRRALLAQINPNDPASLTQAAQKAAQMGDAALLNDVMGRLKTLADVQKEQSAAVKNLREATPTAVREYQLAKAEGYPGSFMDFQTALKKAGASNVSVGVSTGENAYGTAFGKGIADQDLAKYSLAQKAPEILATADTTEKLLQSDKVFTGSGANAKLNLLALGQGLGVTGKNADEIIANTQQLQQQRSQAVLSQIKSSGLGTGQGFTDKDLKFLQDSAAGSITLSKETLQRQINIERKVARAAAKDWNNRLGSMPQKVVGPMGLSSINLPAQTSFDTVEEATAAGLPKGTAITVGGRKAIVE